MDNRTGTWAATIALTVFLVALAIPLDFLFSGSEWSLSFRGHPWFDYLEVPLYLAGILAAALFVALAGAWVLRAVSGSSGMSSVARSILSGTSIFGLSPLQPVFANIILILLVPTLAESDLFPFESLRWIFTISIVALFGLALGAELALRVVETGASDGRDWLRTTASVIGDQAPALAGRMAVLIMAGPLLLTAMAGLGQSPAQVTPDAARFSFPNEGLIVAVFGALLALGLWWAGSRFGRQDTEPNAPDHTPPAGRQVAVWALVAVAALLPLVMVAFADDPLVQRFDSVQAEPSSEHPFGTDMLGRDVMDRLTFAWRDTLYSGFAIGVVLFGLGVFWRLITPFNTSLLQLESILERIPPGVIFFGIWGAVAGSIGSTTNLRTIAVASGIVLAPVAMAAIRRVDTQALPAAFASLVMLGMLLVIGWSTVLGMVGLLTPPLPNFGETLQQGMQLRIEAPWVINYTALTLVVAVALPIAALTALARCYGIPRDLIRLRG